MEEKQIEQEKIQKKQNIRLKVLIIAAIIMFFGVYFIYTLNKLGVFTKKHSKEIPAVSPTVVFEQPKLHVFDETLYLNEFPDTVRFHNPYLIVVQPETRASRIYNLITKRQEKETMEIPLDYWQGNILYNWHGVTTFYNKKSLSLRCDKGFIKSVSEILCVVPKTKDPLDNKLISIDPQTGKKHDLYSSQNLITAISFINGQLYIGETNITSKNTDIRVGDTTIQTPSPVDVIYQMKGNVYYATFKSSQIKRQAAYYRIDLSGKTVLLQETEKILFYTP